MRIQPVTQHKPAFTNDLDRKQVKWSGKKPVYLQDLYAESDKIQKMIEEKFEKQNSLIANAIMAQTLYLLDNTDSNLKNFKYETANLETSGYVDKAFN